MLLAKESFKLFEQYLPFLNNKQKQDLYDYYYLIETENQKYNLTGFSDEKLICEGLIESILIFQAITSSILNLDSKVVLDIGSGVGFPILPYFIINPTFNLTIYEPINKRVNFLEMVIAKLNLQNITIKKIRAEDSKETEKFDFISARAVSELKNLMEISHHLLKQNGICCFLKSLNYLQEIENAKSIKETLGIERISTFSLGQFFTISNVLVYYQKNKKTPEGYPRK